MFSSRLWLMLPLFLWKGRWFWAAWLLVFLLPISRHEARLHFLGSRFLSRLYDQPWQERWMVSVSTSIPQIPSIESAIWNQVRDRNIYYGYPGNNKPASTQAGQLLQKFPREKWLHALALRQSLGWSSLNGRSDLLDWARAGERLDPRNALFPIILAKIYGDTRHKKQREAALERAAKCSYFDDGLWKLKRLALSGAHKAGVQTWSEEWQIWSSFNENAGSLNNQLDGVLNQFIALSYQDLAAASKTKSPARLQLALKRSNELMRVSLLLQSQPCGSVYWRHGVRWAQGAWKMSRPLKQFWSYRDSTSSEFISFARTQKSEISVQLAQKCAARMRLLAPQLQPMLALSPSSSTVLSPSARFWASVGHPFGFGVLAFNAYLLGWWWLLSLFLWRTTGRESKRSARLLPAIVIVAATATMFTALTLLVMNWINSPALARRGPPPGQAEVALACGVFAFFAPPLLLALWCAVRAQMKNRAALALPARQQIEMSLSPLDAFMLTRATGISALGLLGLCFGFSFLWGFLNWQKMTGYDWLRFMWPGIPTRVIDPTLTSLNSPVMPIYSALCAIALGLAWLIAWRYSAEPQRRPVFHEGLRAWKETLGCAIVLMAWVYLALMICCHFSGNSFSKSLNVAATRGEGAFIRGF